MLSTNILINDADNNISGQIFDIHSLLHTVRLTILSVIY